MGIVSQLRDQAGGDTDMGTLADLLRGLAEGRNVDTTPFGMWGVRNMDPGKLATAMDAAEKINQARQQAELASNAQRFGAMAHLAGVQDQGDVALQDQATRERIAAQAALTAAARQQNEMDMKKLWSSTELQTGAAKNKAEIEKANILAGAKTGKVPDMLQMQMLQYFNNPDFDPEKGQGFVNALKSLRLKDEAASIQAMLDAQTERLAAKKAKNSGPGVLGRLTQNPESAVGQAASAYTEWLKRQQAMPNPDFTAADMF